jgi:hypothetical protein
VQGLHLVSEVHISNSVICMCLPGASARWCSDRTDLNTLSHDSAGPRPSPCHASTKKRKPAGIVFTWSPWTSGTVFGTQDVMVFPVAGPGGARPTIVQGYPHVQQGWSRGGKPLQVSFPCLWSNEHRGVIDRRAGSDSPAFAYVVSVSLW